MNETDLILTVSNIVNWTHNFEAAAEKVWTLLGGRHLSGLPRRIRIYIEQQLGMLEKRSALRKARARLEAEAAALREDLATRKTVQRAQGILVTRRGMTPAGAKLWISQQARLTRFSQREVAEQVIAVETVQRLSESSRRIA